MIFSVPLSQTAVRLSVKTLSAGNLEKKNVRDKQKHFGKKSDCNLVGFAIYSSRKLSAPMPNIGGSVVILSPRNVANWKTYVEPLCLLYYIYRDNEAFYNNKTKRGNQCESH